MFEACCLCSHLAKIHMHKKTFPTNTVNLNMYTPPHHTPYKKITTYIIISALFINAAPAVPNLFYSVFQKSVALL